MLWDIFLFVCLVCLFVNMIFFFFYLFIALFRITFDKVRRCSNNIVPRIYLYFYLPHESFIASKISIWRHNMCCVCEKKFSFFRSILFVLKTNLIFQKSIYFFSSSGRWSVYNMACCNIVDWKFIVIVTYGHVWAFKSVNAFLNYISIEYSRLHASIR